MDNFFQKNILVFFLIFVFGIFLGWFLSHPSKNKMEASEEISSVKTKIWTCSSHPEIQKSEPGQCPICDKALVPQEDEDNRPISEVVRYSNNSGDLAKLTTAIVTKQAPTKDIYIYGKVQADEFVVSKQRATISGRLDKMMINATGTRVSKGQLLAQIYSPEYVSAQQDLLEAASNKTADPMSFNEAKSRMIKFGLNELQIASILKKDRIEINTQILSDVTGVVTARHSNDGEYIKKESVIYEIADLSKVWIIFDVSEGDLSFLNKGDLISFTCKSLPGTTFQGNIQYIYPDMDPKTNLTRVRVEFDNKAGLLKPEMHTTGTVNLNLAKYSDQLVVPQSAVLHSDAKTYVYVKELAGDETIFRVRNVTLGPKIGDSFVVLDGISEGEEIIRQGASNLR